MTVVNEKPGPLVANGLLALDDATDAELAGGKGSALAEARRAGLPVLGGAVLTTEFCREVDAGTPIGSHPAIDAVVSAFGEQALAVRSSSPVEDSAESSMAGQFESVLGVEGREELVEAVRTVLDSRSQAAEHQAGATDHPIAVLVQPLVSADIGGVLFGVDPVTGRTDRITVVASREGPDAVVSGEVEGIRNVLDPSGERADDGDDGGGETLPEELRSRLVELAGRTASIFDGPQDVEWLLDADGELHVLQVRPVTTTIRGVPHGPVYGPGPVAETFPEPLSRLERDLWVPPLRTALREALVLGGAASRDEVQSAEVVIAPGGRVAVDLEITGERPAASSWRTRLSPRQRIRRLRSAWRVSRLRAALPALARDLVTTTDRELRAIPPLTELSDRQLVALVDRGKQALTSVHAHEILIGQVVDPDAPELTGASVALRVLAEARREGRSDDQILEESPIVLALCPPRVGPAPQLPRSPEYAPSKPAARKADPAGVVREALRLRVRWIQALTGRAAHELGCRLADRQLIAEAEAVRHLGWADVSRVVLHRAVPTAPEPEPADTAEPLPGAFRMSDRHLPIPVSRAGSSGDAHGAGGGIGTGAVTHDTEAPEPGTVLVVGQLEPSFAPLLGGLAGLVAETGSPLAHLAILAREAGVATVVGLADAKHRFSEGTLVRVDGDTGSVQLVNEEEARS